MTRVGGDGQDHTNEPRTKVVGESVLWFDHYDKSHNVGMRHEDGSLYSATCHDCNVVYYRPNSEDTTT